MTWDRKAPWVDGSLLHYPESYRATIKWRDVEEFTAALRYSHYTRGRSAAYLIFVDAINRSYPVFLTDMETVIPHMVCGVINGVWTVSKRGQNFGLKLVRPLSMDGHLCNGDKVRPYPSVLCSLCKPEKSSAA